MESVAPRIANWLCALRYEDIPADVIAMAKRCMLDQIGVQLRGSTLPQVQAPYKYVMTLRASPQSTIMRYGDRTTPEYAAYVNGTFGHSCEFDDSHIAAGHPGVVVIPAAVALAEAHKLSGRDLIRGIVAGYQGMVLAMGAITYNSLHLGWHNTKTAGVFGSACVTAVLLDMTHLQIVNALGIAGSEASGVMEYDQSGGEVKRLHAGSASRLGMQCALLAREGLTGPSTIFEGKRGMYKMFSTAFDHPLEYFWSGKYHIMDTMFKMWPAVGTVHGALDAAYEIRRAHNIKAEDIDVIDAHVSELTVTHGATIVHPSDCISAQFSLAYSLGLAFARGSNSLLRYLDPTTWDDPGIMNIAERVKIQVRPDLVDTMVLGCELEVIMKDGRVLSFEQRRPRGHHMNPASQADIERKFFELCDGLMPQAQAERIVQMVSRLETLEDVDELIKLQVLAGSE